MTNTKQTTWTGFIARYHADGSFAQNIRQNPTAALKGVGIEIPEGAQVQLHENTDTVFHIAIPSAAKDLGFESLAQTSAACCGSFTGNWCVS